MRASDDFNSVDVMVCKPAIATQLNHMSPRNIEKIESRIAHRSISPISP